MNEMVRVQEACASDVYRDRETSLIFSLPEWMDWLDMKLHLYSQAAEIKSKLKKASEDDRIYHGVCLEIFNQVKNKLLSQTRLSTSTDVLYLFSAACEHLKKKIPFPYGFVISDCIRQLKEEREKNESSSALTTRSRASEVFHQIAEVELNLSA